ncbi:MAG: M48 family metallopeptidase [Candidatus Hodarchaeales archaeon]
MVSIRRIRVSRFFNATVFFLLTFLQMIIVSWISISQIPDEGSDFTFAKILGFYISINPFLEIQFTAVLVILTGGLQVLLLVSLVNVVFSNKNMIQIYPLPKKGIAHSPEEEQLVNKTINIVSNVSARAKIKVKKIFVYRKSVPNAFSLDLIPLPIFRRPYIVLNTNVLEILNENEIEAVVAHELAHVKHGDSLFRLILSIPRLFLNLAYLFIYLQVLTGIQNALFENFRPIDAIERTLFLGLIYLVIAILTKFTVRFLYSANRQAEFLSDYFAARLVGSGILINSLIHLGQRSETMQILSHEIEWLNGLAGEKKPSADFMRNINQRFPRTQLNEEVARKIAPRIFLEEKLHSLMTAYGLSIDEDYRDQLISQAVPSLLEKRTKYFESIGENEEILTPSMLKEKTIDWRVFDSDESYYLDAKELDNFIITLLSHPQKMVFEHEILQTPEKDSDHPIFRTRILQIYKIFHPDNYRDILDKISSQQLDSASSE